MTHSEKNKKTSLFTAITTTAAVAFVAGGLAFALVIKPDALNGLFQSQELYNTRNPVVASATVTNTEQAALDATTPAAGTETKTETPAAPVVETKPTTETPAAAVAAPEVQQEAASAATPEQPVAATPPVVNAGADLIEAAKDKVMGSDKALLTVYDYSSLSCPHCSAFHNTIFPKVKQYYIDTGRVRWVYRTFPHNDQGLRAEMLARCVPSDQYIKLRDLIFGNQERWAFSPSPLVNLAMLVKVAGIDDAKFQTCTNDKALEEVILKIAQDGTDKYKIGSTPTFVFNDNEKKLAGAGTYESFAYEMDAALEDLEDKAKAATQSTPIPEGKL